MWKMLWWYPNLPNNPIPFSFFENRKWVFQKYFTQRNRHAHTRAQSCSPHTYPLMSADALNFINHMKLHVNGKMADDREMIKRRNKSPLRLQRTKKSAILEILVYYIESGYNSPFTISRHGI